MHILNAARGLALCLSGSFILLQAEKAWLE
jgi:hypothetical protein